MDNNNNNNNKFTSNEERENFLDQKFKELQAIQEADLLLDFDKAIEEVSENPYKIAYAGKFYDVPRQMPFNFATFFFRHCYKKINGKLTIDVPDDKIFQFIQLMFGNEMIRALESNRNISVDSVFEKLAIPILEKWGYGVNKDNGKYSSQKKI